MPSTYSTNLRFELMATGEKSGTWGTISNTNIGTLIEQAISGVASVTHDDSASYSLTTGNGTSDEARNAVVVVTGTLTAARNLVVPSVDKLYVIKNSTSGGFNITVKTSAGTGVVVENGNTKVVFCDATNVEEAITEVDLNKLTASAVDITGDLDVDNININGNTISSTDTNGDITLDPDGTGKVNVVGELEADSLDIDGNADIAGALQVDDTLTVERTNGIPSVNVTGFKSDNGYQPSQLNLNRYGATGGAATPSDSNIGDIRWTGLDTDAAYANFAFITASIGTNASGGAPATLTISVADTGTSASEYFRMAPEGTIINELGANHDFRVESDSNTHMFFVDAGDDQIRIKNNTASRAGHLLFDADATRGDVDQPTGAKINMYSGNSNHLMGMEGGGMYFTTDQQIRYYHKSGATFTNLFTVANGGSVFNEDSGDQDFRVESQNRTHCLFINAANDSVQFGHNSAQPYTPTEGTGVGSSIDSETGQIFTSVTAGTHGHIFNRGSGTGTMITFRYGGTDEGSISVTSSGTTYNTISDRRLKTDINPIADATEKLMAMNPVTHRWIADPDDDAVNGFIAQEMQEIMPEAVSGDPEGEEMMAMDYGRITPILVAALQESNKKIEQLEARIAELEAK